jgi:menaquinone-dependent protoporphyrinogen oxidase
MLTFWWPTPPSMARRQRSPRRSATCCARPAYAPTCSRLPKVGDLSLYRAVVLGSAVYIGRWRKGAVRFLTANEPALAEKPVWLFSCGPTGKGDPVALTQGWRFPTKLQPIADRIAPHDVAVFHGALDVGKLNFLERWAIKNVKAPVGDFRDWEAITSWATAIAAVLQEAAWRRKHQPKRTFYKELRSGYETNDEIGALRGGVHPCEPDRDRVVFVQLWSRPTSNMRATTAQPQPMSTAEARRCGLSKSFCRLLIC